MKWVIERERCVRICKEAVRANRNIYHETESSYENPQSDRSVTPFTLEQAIFPKIGKPVQTGVGYVPNDQ
jgi:hypothetical protein